MDDVRNVCRDLSNFLYTNFMNNLFKANINITVFS